MGAPLPPPPTGQEPSSGDCCPGNCMDLGALEENRDLTGLRGSLMGLDNRPVLLSVCPELTSHGHSHRTQSSEDLASREVLSAIISSRRWEIGGCHDPCRGHLFGCVCLHLGPGLLLPPLPPSSPHFLPNLIIISSVVLHTGQNASA